MAHLPFQLFSFSHLQHASRSETCASVLLDRYRMGLWANLRACHYFIRLLSDKGILQRPADARDRNCMGSLFGWFFWMFHSMATTQDHRQTTWPLGCGCIIGNHGEFLSFGTSWHSVWFALFFVQKDLLCMVDFGKLLAFGTYTDYYWLQPIASHEKVRRE